MALTSTDATAIIDNALLNAQTGTTTKVLPAGESGLQPGPIPTTETVDDENLTPEQKKERVDAEKIRKAQEDMLGKEAAEALAEEERKRQERERTVIGLVDKTLQSSKNAGNAAAVKIGNIPVPGNITVPLTLLVLFGFLLIIYAGHTRIQWIWLVLTNNAYVKGGQGTGTGGGPPDATQETTVAIAPSPLSPSGTYGNPYS